MTSLVLELQADALNPSISTLDLLRKASVAATRLKVERFQEWIELELSGYDHQNLIPEYRSVRGSIRAWNPYHGWQPIDAGNQQVNDLLGDMCNCSIHQPISELAILGSSESKELTIQLPFQAKSLLVSLLRTQVKVSVSKSSIQAIIEAVRDIILRWALQLEQDGILGERMTFLTREKQIAAQNDYSGMTQVFYIGQSQMQSSSSESQSNLGKFNNDLRGAHIANFANQVSGSARQRANQYNYTLDQRQTVAEAATEIQQLLEQLSKNYSTETVSGRMQLATEAITRIESDSTLMQRVLSALHAGGVSALEQLLNHPAASFVIAALEDWQKTKGV